MQLANRECLGLLTKASPVAVVNLLSLTQGFSRISDFPEKVNRVDVLSICAIGSTRVRKMPQEQAGSAFPMLDGREKRPVDVRLTWYAKSPGRSAPGSGCRAFLVNAQEGFVNYLREHDGFDRNSTLVQVYHKPYSLRADSSNSSRYRCWITPRPRKQDPCCAQWQDRAHFFAVAAQQLRRILVDYSRAARAEKRGGNRFKVSLAMAKTLALQDKMDILEVDESLRGLEIVDPRAAAGWNCAFLRVSRRSKLPRHSAFLW
jgi:hypothetical protein